MRWSEVGFRPQRPMVGHGARSGDSPASPAAPVRHISGQEKTRNCQYGSRPEVKNINKVKQQSRKFCCLGEVGKELRGKRLPIQCRTSDPLGFGFAGTVRNSGDGGKRNGKRPFMKISIVLIWDN